MPLLTTDSRLRIVSESIDNAIDPEKYRLIAFVFMPEHIHLLVYPLETKPELGRLLAAIKRPVSRRVKETLINGQSPLLEKLTVQERPGKTVFRFWQEGPGYDRNLQTEKAVTAAIDYIHLNPVRRGLCQQARDWKWSSARFYESDGRLQEKDLPTIHGLPSG
jgi:putative transposase